MSLDDYLQPGYWSVVELNVCIICACMPAIYSLIKTFMPKLVSGTVQGTYGTYGKTDPRSTNNSAGRYTPRIDTFTHSTSKSSDFVLLRDVDATVNERKEEVNVSEGKAWPL
jgi:hypothetical protein